MANVPDLATLLNLEPASSSSPLHGRGRSILIKKDFTNSGDFAFNSLLQHFSRRLANGKLVFVAISHDWAHYAASSAKCGCNLRQSHNGGNVEVFTVMGEMTHGMAACRGEGENSADAICEKILDFVQTSVQPSQSQDSSNFVVMIDDLSMLLSLGASAQSLFKLLSSIQRRLFGPASIPNEDDPNPKQANHLIVQTFLPTLDSTLPAHIQCNFINRELLQLVTSFEGSCDIVLALQPLETGYSTRVDGTIKITDNRVPVGESGMSPGSVSNLGFVKSSPTAAGGRSLGLRRQRSYFYKLVGRRAKLTDCALVA